MMQAQQAEMKVEIGDEMEGESSFDESEDSADFSSRRNSHQHSARLPNVPKPVIDMDPDVEDFPGQNKDSSLGYHDEVPSELNDSIHMPGGDLDG